MENSKMFLQGILEDELSTIKIEKKNYSSKPRLKLAKDKKFISNLRIFLNQIKKLIEQFEVKCSEVSRFPTYKKTQKTRELSLDINRNKENIITFSENIGFRLMPEKIKNLKECVYVLEKTRYNRKPIINKRRILALRKKGYTIRQISNSVNLNRSSVHRVILNN